MRIEGEYWITKDGEILGATDGGEYNHEGHVVEWIIGLIYDFLGKDWDGGPDWTYARTQLIDEIFPERYGIDEDDPYTRLKKEMVDNRCFISTKEADAAFNAIGSDQDAREFAIRYWKWTRVAGNNAELPALTPEVLRFVADKLAEILFDYEGEEDEEEIRATRMRISTYDGKGGRYETTIGDMMEGKLADSHTEFDDLTRASKLAVDKMEKENLHPAYRGKLGDSFTRTLKRLLKENQPHQVANAWMRSPRSE